jgi:hypothetical protein
LRDLSTILRQGVETPRGELDCSVARWLRESLRFGRDGARDRGNTAGAAAPRPLSARERQFSLVIDPFTVADKRLQTLN